MDRCKARCVRIVVACACCLVSVVCAAATPSVDDVLRICRANQAKLDPLHVQLTYAREVTDAYRQSYLKQADDYEKLAKIMESGDASEGLDSLKKAGYTPAMLREQAKTTRSIAHVMPSSDRYEYFVRGEAYQVRSFYMERPDAPYSNVSVTPETLVREYSRTRIYTRSPLQSPAVRVWPGQSSPDSPGYVMLTSKHIRETEVSHAPPYMLGIMPSWDMRHPIDTFFNAPAERYRVVGQEVKEGRTLTIVDVSVPHETSSGELGTDGQVKTRQVAYLYRAWLDLDRGGLPVVMHFWHGFADKPFDAAQSKWPPSRVVTTSQITQLDSGAFYPAVTTEVEFRPDPNSPQLSGPEWEEIRAGKRPPPKYVAYEQLSWTCSLVDSKVPADEQFFVLQIPEGQPLYDFDAKKVVGALEKKPFIKAGEKAPAWQIARWLDGQNHTLDEFRGKVVVVDFWGLWCGPCRSSVPAMAMLQEKFKGDPVVFVSVHTADKDPDALAQRIEKFAAEKNWKYLAAIDAGTMSDNSATSHAYGATGFPTHLIIGPDGVVRYNSDEPPPGFEGLMGKPFDEVTPEEEKKFEAYAREQFLEAGEAWPLHEKLSQEQQQEVMNRVNVFHLSRKIDAALGNLK